MRWPVVHVEERTQVPAAGFEDATFAQQPWLIVALTIYAGVLVTSFFIQRPGLRRLLGRSSDATPEEQERWRVRARHQRYVSYGMAAAVGLIGWLMMAKPGA